MSYLTVIIDKIEKALFMRKFNVPFWALSYVFGKDPMYWYRIEQTIGRNSIVGTTVRNPDDLPQHLGAKEITSIKIIGIDRVSLWRKIKKYGLE